MARRTGETRPGFACVVLTSLLAAVHTSVQPPGGGEGNETSVVISAALDGKTVMDASSWRCSMRAATAGRQEACMLTGLATSQHAPRGAGANLAATCGWKTPVVFCDDSVQRLVAALLPRVAAPAAAGADYTLVPGVGHFKVHADPASWQQGAARCEAEGAQLAVPATPADYAAILVMIHAVLPDQEAGVFVGLTDVAQEGAFVSVRGQPLCTLQLAVIGEREPTDAAPAATAQTATCMVMAAAGHAVEMTDVDCSLRLPFICERPLPALVVGC